MPNTPDPFRRGGALLFTAAACGGAVALAWIIRSGGGMTGSRAALAYAYMTLPALGALAVRLALREGWKDSGLRWPGWRWMLGSWGLALGMTATVYGLAWLSGGAKVSLDPAHLAALGAGAEHIADLKPWKGWSMPQMMLLFALINLTVANVPGILLGLGEELGWRGYLLPRLLPLGRWPAMILLGVIWWAWHLPLGAASPGTFPKVDVPATLVVGLLGSIGMGAILCWIRCASGSLLPAALLHIAFNNASNAAVLVLDARIPVVQASLLASIAGVLGWITWRKGWSLVRPEAVLPPRGLNPPGR